MKHNVFMLNLIKIKMTHILHGVKMTKDWKKAYDDMEEQVKQRNQRNNYLEAQIKYLERLKEKLWSKQLELIKDHKNLLDRYFRQ